VAALGVAGVPFVRQSKLFVAQGKPLKAEGRPFVSQGKQEAQSDDLAYARDKYVRASRAFSDVRREQALELISNSERRAGKLSEAEFLVGIERVAALSENAHDAVQFDEASIFQKRLPFRIIWFRDAMVIARAGPPVAELAGARILSVEGLTPAALLARFAEVCGGTESYRLWNTTWAIESEGILAALGIAKGADRVRLMLAMPHGEKVERVVEMVPTADVPNLRAARLWSGELTEEEKKRGWRTAIDARTEPVYLRDADEPFRLTTLEGSDTTYLQFRTNYDLAGRSIRGFAEKTRETLGAHHVRNLIVDLRFDSGGDITRTAELMREIPKDVTGRMYLLVARYTFSAGIVAAALVKHYGANQVRIVGEEVGDRLRWWSEGHDACLPHADLCMRVTDGLWDLVKGCKAEPNCYGDRFAAAVGSLRADVDAPLTAEAWLSGRDLGMEVVKAELRK